MTNYRDFADSFFSSAIWSNEGAFLLIVGILVIIGAGTLFLYGITPSHDPEQTKFSFYALILIATSVGCTVFLSPHIVDLVNRNVAKHNIAVKYDTSNLEFLTYSDDDHIFTARYTDNMSNIHEDLTFAFVKGDNAPFLIKRNNSEANFSKIEKIISKPMPATTFASYVK